jgi:hypothetical protein
MIIALLLSTLRDTVETFTFRYREGLNRAAFAVTVKRNASRPLLP